MMKLILTHIPIECGVVDPYVYRFLNCSVKLTHRAKTVCTKPELYNNETQHLRKALTIFKYPMWALDQVIRKPSIGDRKIVM